ncbi:hypothetical protein [Tateyamaria pelophila]|uniref:hypothetical protein n=1 Tax=Tateyamaria pelophila TaxID=328415 RepID=UPI001CBE9A42|nr:hypothetical protein [Tateyamaria pelophila]
MTILKAKRELASKIFRQIATAEPEVLSRLSDLDWFGIEVSWPDDEALFSGDLAVKLWDEFCIKNHSRTLILSPFRVGLEDEYTLTEIGDAIESQWERTVELRHFDLSP